MVRSTFSKLVFLSLIGILIFTQISCGGSSGTPSKTIPSGTEDSLVQLINGVTAATNDIERSTALEKVVATGQSLGIVDENGNQLNPNVAKDAVSLTPGDVAALNYLATEGQGRTIGSIVDYLASVGVVLSSTQKVITFNDLLPDLQKYVNWSFQNRNDPKASLGILLASGADMKIPNSPPTFNESTLISPTVSLMMLSDILLGVPQPVETSSRGFLGSKVCAASELEEVAGIIQGNLTLVEGMLKGFNISIPEYAKQLIAAFAAGNRLKVRIVYPYTEGDSGKATVVKSMRLAALKGQTEYLTAMVVLIPSGEILQEIPVTYNLNLISTESGFSAAAQNLYPDADAILFSEGQGARLESNGHRLGVVGRLPDQKADFAMIRSLTENTEPRTAILHASAFIKQPDMESIRKKYGKAIDKAGFILGLSMDDLEIAMKQGLYIFPWMCSVVLAPKSGIAVEPSVLAGETGQKYTFTAKIDSTETYTVIWWQGSADDYTPPDSIDLSGVYTTGITQDFTWNTPGSYTVTAGAYVRERGGEYVLMDAATAKVTIKSITAQLNLTITKSGLESTIEPVNFKISNIAEWPQNNESIWDAGDGTAPYIGTSSSQWSHRYSKPGKYILTYTLRDRTTKEVLGKADTEVNIDDLAVLQTMKKLTINVLSFYTYEFGVVRNGVFTKQGASSYYADRGGANNLVTFPLKWEGNRCYGEVEVPSGTDKSGTVTFHIEATVSDNEMTVLTATYSIDHYYPNHEGTGRWNKSHFETTVKNVELSYRSSTRFSGKVEGSQASNYFVSHEWEQVWQERTPAEGDGMQRFAGVDWNNTSQGTPRIAVEFKVQE